MIPIGADSSDRERASIVTALLVAVNVAVFLYELYLHSQGPELLDAFIQKWSVIPAAFGHQSELAEFHASPLATLITAMFMHGGWAHLLGNMLYLAIFAPCVEDRLGHGWFTAFYLFAGVAAALAQSAASLHSEVAMLGASGAISGVLGAFITMFPSKEVRVILVFRVVEMRAWFVLGFWALTQFAGSYGPLAAKGTLGGVAFVAHIGGFLTGAAAGLLWRAIVKPPSPKKSYLG